jgi:8-oxo-dGTP pyrophosphatase MutT (NUDIX family)
MSLYNRIGRFITPIMRLIFFIYNHLTHVPRARVLVLNEANQLLLVRGWINPDQWQLPGGGVQRGEGLVQAARRELLEETGVKADEARFEYLLTIRTSYEAPIFVLRCVRSEVPVRLYNPKEIIAVEWFDLSALPLRVSPLVIKAVQKLSNP